MCIYIHIDEILKLIAHNKLYAFMSVIRCDSWLVVCLCRCVLCTYTVCPISFPQTGHVVSWGALCSLKIAKYGLRAHNTKSTNQACTLRHSDTPSNDRIERHYQMRHNHYEHNTTTATIHRKHITISLLCTAYSLTLIASIIHRRLCRLLRSGQTIRPVHKCTIFER